MGPYVKYCNVEANRGITGIAVIETSHIAIHVWDEPNPALMQIDVYSCAEFDVDEIAEKIKSVVGFDGTIDFDFGKPDGMPKKILDSKKLFNLGWRPSVKIESGLEETYKWFKSSFLTECSNK